MKRLLARRPSPAMVIACVALFVALGGVSYGFATGSIDSRELQDGTIRSTDIRGNSIRTEDLRNNEVRGRDIRNSTIAGVEVSLNSLTGSDIRESALDIDESLLAKVPDADHLDGIDSSSFVRRGTNPFQPASLASGWTTLSGGQAPAYDADGLEYVHLRGALRRNPGSTQEVAFVLPAGMRPAAAKDFFVYSRDATGQVLGSVRVEPDGEVRPAGDGVEQLVSLEGVVFRAGG